MLSRRDKLLIQPWEQRRFKDHRFKVQSALPAIDDSSPPPRPHVACKLKKLRHEAERAARIQSDNYSLLQRLGTIMRVNRLDNRWLKPLPNFSQQKVGLFLEPAPLQSKLRARARALADCRRVEMNHPNVKCGACEARKSGPSGVLDLPPIF